MADIKVELPEVVIKPRKPLVTVEQLNKILPSNKAFYPKFIEYLNDTMYEYDITTPNRIHTFIAQLLHESGGFRYVKEIASGEAYDGRLNLGNTQKGDGVKFKGRGLIQTTGRSNYAITSQGLFGDDRLLENPELLETPENATRSAGFFWDRNNLNTIADNPDSKYSSKGVKYNAFEWLTKKINGGQNGLADRKKYYEAAKKYIK